MSLTRRGRIVALLSLLALAVALAAVGLLYLRSIGVVGCSDPGAPVEVVVPVGASAPDVGELLEDEGIVASAFGFRVAAYLQGGADDIEAGRYRLSRNLTARDALAALRAGPRDPAYVNVTFPEGSWITDFARILARDTDIRARAFVSVATSGRIRSRIQPSSVDTLEGLLWPSTYQVVQQNNARSVVRRLVAEFERRLETVDLSRPQAMGYSAYEVVVIASMVEAEAKVDEDRSKISRVVYNRLDHGMRLEIDATIAYALGEHKRSLRASDLEVDSPYNTRKHAGLPPTPIGAPGMASLQAAARPADGDWLYYVLADCAGHHAFSADYEHFLADKAAYRALEC